MGYFSENKPDRKGCPIVDPERAPIIRKMFKKIAYEKWSGPKLFHWLKFDLNFKTPLGNKGLTLSSIYLILQNTSYYGQFEFPHKSGIWYKGRHEPIITKELFDLVQEQMRVNVVRVESKEFAFTKLMKCGLCGSGVSADEKFKTQKNGNIHRYVYYGCTKFRDKNCKSGYIAESKLIKEFELLISTIDLHEIGIKEKLKMEVERFQKFQKAILNLKEKVTVQDIDIRNYAKYVLREGSDIEKRELLGCLKSEIRLANHKVYIMPP